MRLRIHVQIKTLERAGGFIVFRFSGQRRTGRYIPLNQIVWC